MRNSTIQALMILILMLLLGIIGLASCSNPDERPMDNLFLNSQDPLPASPVGLVISDPQFRVVEPDPLINESYKATAITMQTTQEMWGMFLNATKRIDLVGTRVTNPDMVSRLVSVANKGVKVNLVVEEGYFTDQEASYYISQLGQNPNITLKTDNDGIARQVHSRYAIIDDHIVLVSSGDFLDETFNTSVNNTLIFNTPRTYTDGAGASGVTTITDAFLFDFDQMFNQGLFGGNKATLNNHTFNIGSMVEIYFGPNDNLLAEIYNELQNMNTNLYYAIKEVNDPDLLNIIMNYGTEGYYDTISNLAYIDPYLENGIGFTWPGYNSLNHKFIIIDMPANVTNTINPVVLDLLDPVVITGSANWTHNGLRLNDEVMVIVHDLTLAFKYAIEISALSRESQGYGVVYGKIRTNKNVPIMEAEISCDSNAIPGGAFPGDGGQHPEGMSDARGFYFMFVRTGFVRNIHLTSIGEATTYLFPDPIWGPDSPNEGYNLLPGASLEVDFYLYPQPHATGT
ncbi:MAG: phospholipase D-like domain-containing protein [bacterium]